MHPPSNEIMPSNHLLLRRCLVLSCPLIATATSLPDAGVESLLCGTVFDRNHETFDYSNTHLLRCSHRVWCTPARPCGYSCVDGQPCQGSILLRDEKEKDVIICQECVMRAELVYTRYERMDRAMMSMSYEAQEDEGL
jgi:hypothetical protein